MPRDRSGEWISEEEHYARQADAAIYERERAAIERFRTASDTPRPSTPAPFYGPDSRINCDCCWRNRPARGAGMVEWGRFPILMCAACRKDTGARAVEG